MPRIDPLQLLKCLSVLLTPEGGILSRDEVPRLVNLMTKFSKKLVSKCVYVLILKNTETDLVDMFMAEGGWTLIQTWLQDAVQTGNWDLVREILGLLLITPVDVERLKLNILPKLIKSLSRRDELEGVAKLSTQLVQQWLAIVKGSSNVIPQHAQVQTSSEKIDIIQPVPLNNRATDGNVQNIAIVTEERTDSGNTQEGNSEAISTNSFYKPTVRDGKLVIRKLASDASGEVAVSEAVEEVTTEPQDKSKEEDREKKSEEKDKEKSKSSSSRRSRSSSHSSSKDKDRDRKKSSSSKSSSSRSKSSSSSSRDKDRKDKEKDRRRSTDSPKTSSSSSKTSSTKDRRDSKDKDKDKEKQAEKDKDTLAKIKPQTIEKLGRIPRKPNPPSPLNDKAKESKENKEIKKKSFSIGIRKDSEERPKTVKIFNSKMRSTGLEEEVKPAPPRPVKKPTPTVQLPTIPPKRPSPPRDHRDPILPPEKKLKIDKMDIPERPGAIKLIPPKPKPMLQESDLFMDALTASATTKKEPKKRKRRPSVTKDCPSSPSSSPAGEQPQTPTSPSQNAASNSPSLGIKSIAPINFYQDTLSTEDTTENEENSNKENPENNKTSENNEEGADAKNENNDTPSSPTTPTDDNNVDEECSEPKKVKLDDGLKGVLLYTKKKGPKRTISWKADADLVEIRYFELDETERVNVTKTFGDMAKMEMSSEREALQLSRKNIGEDSMESQIMWRLPYIIEQPEPLALPGHKSLEKDIQFAREKSILQFLYFDKRRLPDSPEEPIPENHQMSDPVLIPLEDPDSQEIDLRNTPWPDPKGSPPPVEPQMPPHIFPTIPGPFNPPFSNMPPPQFQGIPPRFNGLPGARPVGPGNFIPPNVMNGNMMGPPNMGPPNDMINQGPINPNMFPPGPGPDGFGPGPDFPIFSNQNPPNNINMFPPNNFNNHNNHRQGNRGGGYRRGGGGNNGNWVRMSGPGNWKRGGGGHRGGRMCKNIQNHGYCRNGDNCPFVHP